MKKSISIIKKEDKEDIESIKKRDIKTDLIFLEIEKDRIGRSGSNPTWGDVYSNKNSQMEKKGIAIYKEYDYDFPKAAYGEKAWSIFGKELFGDRIRVPDIDIVEQVPHQAEIISYRLMDNNTEDMHHIKDILFHKFKREEMQAKKSIFTIDEILECVKLEINNEENYKKIEKDMIHVLLLDAITNNGDRHALNWALVRDERTSQYSLAVFDHASSFVDMFEDRSYVLGNGWSSSYITVGRDRGRNTIGSDGKVIVEYISEKYSEYFEEFYEEFSKKLPRILELIKEEKMDIDYRRLCSKMEEKKYFMKKLRNRGELEYE